MNAARESVLDRRRALVADSERHRDTLTGTLDVLGRQLALVDAVITAARGVHRHRALLGAAAGLLVLAPLGARQWIGRATWLVPLVVEGFRLARSRGRAGRETPATEEPR
jgi:hypothetical protein